MNAERPKACCRTLPLWTGERGRALSASPPSPLGAAAPLALWWVWGLTLLLSLAGCDGIERFDNSDGSAFCGNIVPGSFVRSGFSPRARLELMLDTAGFGSRPGRLTLVADPEGPCDGTRFRGALLRESQKARADAISAMTFGESQESNIVAWADSECDGTYLVVVSLIFDGTVEVRLMNSRADEEGLEDGAFGVFRLSKTREDCAEGQ